MSDRGKLAIVPLAAIAVAFVVSSVRQRRAHDPDVAHHAVEVLAPTNDPLVALKELDVFFEETTVDWDLKTEVEIACGPDRIRAPVACVRRARRIAIEFEADERIFHRRYTWLMYCGIGFGVLASIFALRTWRSTRKLESKK